VDKTGHDLREIIIDYIDNNHTILEKDYGQESLTKIKANLQTTIALDYTDTQIEFLTINKISQFLENPDSFLSSEEKMRYSVIRAAAINPSDSEKELEYADTYKMILKYIEDNYQKLEAKYGESAVKAAQKSITTDIEKTDVYKGTFSDIASRYNIHFPKLEKHLSATYSAYLGYNPYTRKLMNEYEFKANHIRIHYSKLIREYPQELLDQTATVYLGLAAEKPQYSPEERKLEQRLGWCYKTYQDHNTKNQNTMNEYAFKLYYLSKHHLELVKIFSLELLEQTANLYDQLRSERITSN